jgi:lysophospholipase L1-like esterase
MNPDNDQKDEVRTARAAQSGAISLSEFDGALESFAELARANNFKPILSYAPAAHVSYKEAVTFALPELEGTMLQYSEAQRSYIAKKCAGLGIVFVDLTPVLQAKIAELNGTKLLYNPDNIHFNMLGHHVVSEAVKAVLIREGVAGAP